MDGRWMHRKIMLLLHPLAMRGSDVASLVEFRQVVKKETGTNVRTTDARMHVASLVEFHPVV